MEKIVKYYSEVENRSDDKEKICRCEKTTMKDSLLLHLHEQYAINNNANLGSMITLMAAVIAIIGGYGYVFLHLDMSVGKTQLLCTHPNFSLVSLILAATVTTIVLAILKYICMYQGLAQRKEQFIIYAIRCNNGLSINKETTTERIFPNTYHPFGKKGNEIYQGLFGELIKIFKWLQFIIFISIVLPFCLYLTECKLDIYIIASLVLYIISCIVCYICYLLKNCKDQDTYSNLCDKYKGYWEDDCCTPETTIHKKILYFFLKM